MAFIFSLHLEYSRDLQEHINRMEVEDLLKEIMGEKPENERAIEKCKDRLWELERSISPL